MYFFEDMGIPIQIINNTGTVNLNQTDVNWLLLVAPIVAGIIGFFTIWYSRQQHNRNAIIDVFRMLNTEEQKNAENIIIEAYKYGNLYHMGLLNDPFVANGQLVSRNYNQVGLLAKRKLIPRNDYFQMFGIHTVVYHHMLFSYIKDQRIIRGDKDFRSYFTELSIDCYNYWKKEGYHEILNPMMKFQKLL